MDTYKCAACGGTFTKGWTDEEAAAEAASVFTPEELKDTSLVCDPCWREMRAAMPDFAERYVDARASTAAESKQA